MKRGQYMKKLLILALLVSSLFVFSACASITTLTTQSDTTTTTTTTAPTTTTTTVTQSTASTTPEERYQTIELFSLNDFHGGAYSSLSTFSKMGDYLKYKRLTTDNTIIIANGDILQGSAFSNYYHGRPIIEIMNYLEFDAFVLGNHEFDWGIDEIAKYADGNLENGEADYPFLAANIVTESDSQMMPWTDPYTIVDINGVKVGIIGVIGDVINSITASRVAGYDFQEAYDLVREYAYELRTEQDCDIVVVSIHEYNQSVNEAIAALSGDYLVDAIFNGHTHSAQKDYILRNGTRLPYAQASNYSSSLLAKITLVYDRVTGNIISALSANISESSLLSESTAVNMIIDEYSSVPAYQTFISEELAFSNGIYSKYDLAPWGSSVIRDYAGVDFGMMNAGGFRVSIETGAITMGDLVDSYIFDNYIMTSQVTGAMLNDFCIYVETTSRDVVFDDSVSCDASTGFKVNGQPLVNTQLYTIAAVDYVFEKTDYVFLKGINITNTGLLIRDLLAMDLRATIGFFNPANGTSYQAVTPQKMTPYFFPSVQSKFIDDMRRSIA